MSAAKACIPALPPRPVDAHKGSFGHAVIVGGSRGLSGAPVLAARAALRIGAGLVTLAGPESVMPAAIAPFPEIMGLFLPDKSGSLHEKSMKPLCDYLREQGTVMAIGPGLGRLPRTLSFVARILESVNIPMVIDADALFALSKKPALLKKLKPPVVITPHPGEASRLLGKTVSEIQADREGSAHLLQEITGAVVVLKGHNTVVADGKATYINSTGGPELAKGGSGDILTGVIAGLLAQGMKHYDAAVLGVYLHGKAGELAAGVSSMYSVIAGDVIDKLSLTCRIHSSGPRGGA